MSEGWRSVRHTAGLNLRRRVFECEEKVALTLLRSALDMPTGVHIQLIGVQADGSGMRGRGHLDVCQIGTLWCGGPGRRRP